jgi:hypothetical protein
MTFRIAIASLKTFVTATLSMMHDDIQRNDCIMSLNPTIFIIRFIPFTTFTIAILSIMIVRLTAVLNIMMVSIIALFIIHLITEC